MRVSKRQSVTRALVLGTALFMLTACRKQETPEAEMTVAETSPSKDAPSVSSGFTKSAVSKPAEPIAIRTGYYWDSYWDETAYSTTASVSFPLVELGEKEKEKYSGLADSVKTLMEQVKEDRLNLYSAAIQRAAEERADDPEFDTQFYIEESARVKRADTVVVSLLLDGSVYMGGQYENRHDLGYVFDTETGKLLSLDDVVNDRKELPDLVFEALKRFRGEENIYGDLDPETCFESSETAVSWTLDCNGITFYFNPSVAAPFEMGVVDVTLSFADYPQLVREKYRNVPESYGTEFAFGQNFYFDLDGDGSLDCLDVTAGESESGGYEDMTVWLNGEPCVGNDISYMIEPVLLHTKDGKNWLYVGQQYPDDFWVFQVYDVSHGYPENVGIVYSGCKNYISDSGYYIKEVLTDPDSFMLETWTNLLGIEYGYDSCHVGADGLPVKENDGYFIDSERNFTMLNDLSVTLVDEAGNSLGEAMLKKGDTVTYCRTDGYTYADLKLSDGRIGRVFTEQSDWNYTVEGADIGELFDGMNYEQ